jgi:subtilase family serine protease
MSLPFRVLQSVLFLPLLLILVLSQVVSRAAAQSPSLQANRIANDSDLLPTTRLASHVPAWATAANDAGPASPSSALHLTFVLSRSPERQAAFNQLLDDQQNPSSPNFHHWLTPQQIGIVYGPTEEDLEKLAAWLTTQGLSVTEVAPSRLYLTVEAPISTVASALSVNFHSFSVRDRTTGQDTPHLATTIDPAIPTALATIVTSIRGLADVAVFPMHHSKLVAMTGTSNATPIPLGNSATPGEHFIAPNDFAAIYGLDSTYQSGINGNNQKVAIIGRSRVDASDITIFESLTGLPSKQPNVIVPPQGADPGITNTGDQDEATLDVDRVLGTAPGAQADLVISTNASGGIETAAQYEVQTLRDPVMNISFGSCETSAGSNGVNFWDGLFSQAAAEGISTFVSSGDSGVDACEAGTPGSSQSRSINAMCSSSYATCVGGTEFADFANPSAYWNSSNDSGLGAAFGYIAEGAWNEPTVTAGSSTVTALAATGGGPSAFITKPTWQTGAGVPADGFRDVPDVSFSASAHDGYLVCLKYTGADCVNFVNYFSGTSASVASMSGIAALLNQKTGTSQGNINPLLYRLAAHAPDAFHDAVPATSGVALCDVGTPSMCNNSTPGSTAVTGGLAGFALTAGYDLATGLGSLQVTDFLNAATAPPPSPASTEITIISTLFNSPATTINTSQTVSFTATVGPASVGTMTGTVQFFSNGTSLGAPVPIDAQNATTPAENFPTVGTYNITATYSGDANYATSTTNPGVNLIVAAAPAASTITTLSIASPTVVLAGSDTFTVVVSAATPSTTIPTGNVQFYNGSTPLFGAIPLTSGKLTTFSISAAAVVGNGSITAVYLGDSNFLGSTSPPQPLTVTRQATSVGLFPTFATVSTGVSDTFTASIEFTSFGVPGPTGTVQFFQGTNSIGTAPVVNGKATLAEPASAVAGSYTITAVYSGDANYLGATSAAVPVTVSSDPPYQLSASPASITLRAGATTENGTLVMIRQTNNFVGNVNLGCTVAYSGTGTVNAPPTCAFQGNFIPFPGGTTTSLMTITTLAPQAVSAIKRPDSAFDRWRSIAMCSLFLWLITPRRLRIIRRMTALTALLVFFGIFTGCGGSSVGGNTNMGPTPPTAKGTTPGIYTVTINSTNTAGVPPPSPITVSLTVN